LFYSSRRVTNTVDICYNQTNVGFGDPAGPFTRPLTTGRVFMTDIIKDKKEINIDKRMTLDIKHKKFGWFLLPKDTWAELLDSLEVGVVVYRSMDGYVSVLAANKYMTEIFGREDKAFEDFEGDDLHDFIYVNDWDSSTSLRQILTTGEGGSASQIYRLKTRQGAVKWFYVRGASTLMKDGAYIFSVVYSDINDRQKLIDEYDMVIQELLVTNPHSRCAYRLDLTENVCRECHGATKFTQSLIDAKTADELLMKVSEIITDTDIRDRFRRVSNREGLIDKFRRGETKETWKYRRLTEDGGVLWVETYFNLMENPSNDHIEAIAYTLDIDREHKEGQLLALASETDYDMFGTLNPETGDLDPYYSKTPVEQIPKEFLNHYSKVEYTASRIGSTAEREAYLKTTDMANLLSELNAGRTVSQSYTTREGKRKTLNFTWLDESHREVAFFIRDITALVKREEENADILRDALNAAETANKAKSDFLSSMSHEIRTPMNAILGFAQLLKNDADDPDKVKEDADKILSSGQHLLTLINEVLDMSKIESGAMKVTAEEFSLNELISATEDMMRSRTDARHQDFKVITGEISHDRFISDKGKLQQILINVLSNACKFTDEGGHIRFTVTQLRDEPGKHSDICFEIADDGHGMSEEYQKVIFDPFSREEAMNKTEGTGLGMSITHSLVEQLGGTITLESKLGVGSTFTIVIPMRTVEADKEAPGDAASVPGRNPLEGLKILAAEDNELNGEILTEVMRINGAEVTVEPDGEKCLKRFMKSPVGTFDLILLDIQMPVMNGLETARAIRSLAGEEAKTIPIMAMSANAFTDDIQKSLDAGMNEHLSKPINVDAVKKAVAKYIGK